MNNRDWQKGFDEKFVDRKVKQVDSSNSIVIYPWKHPHSHQSQEVKAFIQAELNKVREEGARAGLQEGMEGVIGLILEELDIAEQDKEMAENPDDPKIRIAYLRDKLLRISLAEKE